VDMREVNRVVLQVPVKDAGDLSDEKLELLSLASGDAIPSFSNLGGRWVRGRSKALANTSLPPKIDTTPTLDHVFRYTSTANTLVTITVADIFGALGVMGTVTNSKVQPMFGSFRINSLTIWPAASASTNSDIDLIWAGGANSYIKDSEKERSIPAGISVTGPMRFFPPKGSEMGLWHAATATGNLFSVMPGTGSIIDFHVTYTGVNAFTAGNITVATAVIGTVYYLALDGVSTHVLVPRGLTTTF